MKKLSSVADCAIIRGCRPQQYGIRCEEVNLSLYEMLSQDLAESLSGIAAEKEEL